MASVSELAMYGGGVMAGSNIAAYVLTKQFNRPESSAVQVALETQDITFVLGGLVNTTIGAVGRKISRDSNSSTL